MSAQVIPFAPQDLKQSIRESRRLQNRRQQDETLSGIFMARHLQAGRRTVPDRSGSFGAIDQPEIQALFLSPQIGHQFGVETFRVVDQISGMHLEETGQQHPRVIGQMPAGAVFDLRKIGLADRSVALLPDGAHHFLLRHFPAQTAQRAFHLPQVP